MTALATKRLGILAVIILILGLVGLAFWYVQQPPRESTVIPADGASATPTWNARTQGSYITSAALDQQGHIWVGSETNGIWLNDGAAWRHLAVDGADNSIYSISVDTIGRVWVGHLRHGVSVFNGKSWQHYDATRGPLGQHVFCIAVCPKTAARGAGDVWIATELGLTRYSAANDSWSYFTRADGLPSDQASSMAFDADGNLYLGLQCDGLAIAQPADDYKTWRRVLAPDLPPPSATGDGIPGNKINAVIVAHDGTIFVATDHGLARSGDHGANWTFARGKDWIAKLKDSIDGPPAGWQPTDDAKLAEDYVATLAEDDKGLLWIGYRSQGWQCVDEKNLTPTDGATNVDDCSVILPIAGTSPLIGTRGRGVVGARGAIPQPARISADTAAPQFPAPAKAPTAAELAALTAKVKARTESTKVAAYLGEDWATQGDWVGRYGRQQTIWPYYGLFNSAKKTYVFTGDNMRPFQGPHHLDDIGRAWTYFASLDSKLPNVLYAPGRGRRILGEWNDGGWQKKFGPNFDGPDLWFDVTLPAGQHRVTLYIYNIVSNAGPDRFRDYTIEVKNYVDGLDKAQHAPVLAHARVRSAENVPYRTFLLTQGRYWLRVASNYSHMVGVSAIFFDRADFTAPAADDSTSHYLHGVKYDPPAVPPQSADESPQLQAARELWNALNEKYGGAVDEQLTYRMLAYRAALEGTAPDQTLANWRWNLHLWTDADRADWDQVMAESKKLLPPTTATTPQ